MAKKNIVARARLVKGTNRWYIDFTRYNAETDDETRHRHDFGLNDIEDLRIRQEVGDRLVQYIEHFAPAPAAKKTTDISSDTVAQAVQHVLALKMALPRKNSRKTYRAICAKLLSWCHKSHYAALPAPEFRRKHSNAFWDMLVASGDYNGRTLNNYLVCLRTLWNVMIDREICPENPWTKIKPERVGEKTRRPFAEDERRAVAAEIQRCDYWLFRAVLLLYFCYLRPAELLRLRFKSFDLGRGLVTVESSEAKTWKKRVVTIPASVRHYFVDGIFEKYAANLLVFGRVAVRPGVWELVPAREAISECRLNKRHRRILERLRDAGQLRDIAGLSLYSWKDTGISVHTRKTSPIATRDQAGHADLNTTGIYYHPDPVNMEYQQLENDLF